MTTPGRNAALALVACAALAACKEEAPPPVAVRPVLSTVVTPDAAENAVVVGTVQPQFKTELGFRVLGRLILRSVNIGDSVVKGQTVAAIDPAALELAVRMAKADLSTSQAQFVNAAGTEGRQRTLIETDATTKATLDSAEQARAMAESSVARSQANLIKAREQLGYAQVKADFAGVVTAVGAEVGQVVSPGQSVVTVARPDIREAVIDVSDEAAAALQIGQPFVVHLQLEPRIHANGKIREIAPQADPVTRSRRVRITLDDPPDTFRLGSTITTTLAAGDGAALRLPSSAVLAKDGKTFVWLVQSEGIVHRVTLREVQTADDNDGGVRITSGLASGARVVTAGVHSLTEGQQVRLDQEALL